MAASARATTETAVYVYGITASGRTARGRGISDGAVATVEHGELAAIVSRVGEGPLRAKRRDLLRHSDVLQEAFAQGPVVPLRFGTVFRSEESVVNDLLAMRYEELVALLQRVDGLAELRVRAHFVERELLADIVAHDPGIAALRAATAGVPAGDPRLIRLGEEVARAVAERRLRAADEVVAQLSPLALEVDIDEPREELEILRGSFLVDRNRTRPFERDVEAYARRHRNLVNVELIGPMPPHSFVALDAKPRS